MKTILLTAAGGAGTIEIIKSLKGKFRIIAIDMNKNSVGLYLADKAFVVPPCTDIGYASILKKIVEEENVSVIIPLIDEEIIPLFKIFQGEWPKILCPTLKAVKLCHDKYNLAMKLLKLGLDPPKTYSVEEFKKENIYPCIIKLRKGRGSRGFSILYNKNDFDRYMSDTLYKEEELMIQEKLNGTEFTVSLVINRQNEILSTVPKEIILKEGITKIGVTRKNLKIIEACNKIVSKIKFRGPVNFQLFWDGNSVKLFEINPRFSTTVALTIMSGVNEVEILLLDIFEEKYEVPAFKENLVMMRYTSQIYFDEGSLSII